MVIKAHKKQALKSLFITLLILIVVNIISNYLFKRLDLTHDKRYTLSKTTLNLISQVNEPLTFNVYLEGNFPPEFKKLQNETKQLLEEFSAYNNYIQFTFTNPLENTEKDRVSIMKDLYAQGLQPLNITVEEKGKKSQEVVFPWATATYKNKSTKIGLLKNFMGASTEQKVVSSVQHLEYAFAEAINKIVKDKQKSIAVLKGNGQINDIYIADFLKTIRESYFIAPFTLDSVETNSNKTLNELKKYDLAIVAKPTIAFTDKEKQVIDQYIMNGGKTLWLVDGVSAELDSLYNESGSIVGFAKELNLTDMFFKYGLRINPLLIKDEYATPIKLASGNKGSETQYENYIWKFSPFTYPSTTHPIVKNIEGVKFEFASPIEILKNNTKKTVLLSSSQYSKTVGTPVPISLSLVTEETSPKDYEGKGLLPMAILVEGKFNSVFQNRILPFKDDKFLQTSEQNKMIIISDGDVIKNQTENGVPLELGYDKWTNNFYGNKEFLLNCTNFLLDDKGLINLRTKEVNLPLLNKQKVYENYTFIQIIVIIIPLLIIFLFWFIYKYLHKKYYSNNC